MDWIKVTDLHPKDANLKNGTPLLVTIVIDPDYRKWFNNSERMVVISIYHDPKDLLGEGEDFIPNPDDYFRDEEGRFELFDSDNDAVPHGGKVVAWQLMPDAYSEE